MYEKFFGIDEPPFRLTPDPRYLFLSAKHREALGHLVYGIHEGAGLRGDHRARSAPARPRSCARC